MSTLVHFLRTGEYGLYEKLCKTVGEVWRIPMALGDSYYHDPNFLNPDPRVVLPTEGTLERFVFFHESTQ
jgi:hypothetical protein